MNEPNTILDKCRGFIEKNNEVLSKRYLLDIQECVLICTYTHNGSGSVAPYEKINSMLMEGLIEFQKKSEKSYLRLFLRTLRKLSMTKPQTLYRALKSYHEYKEGEEIDWKNFSSASKVMSPVQIFLNCGARGNGGTLFEIRGACGYCISDFSLYPYEQGIK